MQHCLMQERSAFPLAIESVLRHLCNRSQQERLSLIAVKDAYRSPRFSSWKGFNCCEWEGVQCDTHSSHVVEIHLHKFLLSGEISPALFELKHLEYLDLSYNDLTGAIPAGLFKLQELKHLDLSGNWFGWISIPEELGSLKELNYLDLSMAGFNGTLPWQLGNLSQLQFLDLSTKGGEILKSSNLGWIRNLSSVKYLSLDGVEGPFLFLFSTSPLSLLSTFLQIPFLPQFLRGWET
eukprot:Gb_24233 [translate_table: standard]